MLVRYARRRDAAKDGFCEASRNYRGRQDIGEDLRCSKGATLGTRFCKSHGAETIREAQNVILLALGLPEISR